ncbi:MAG: hypothetical protein Q9190_002951 [Brigantiaea leucoxantha]
MAIPGQRFNIELNSDDETSSARKPKNHMSWALVGDIKERPVLREAKVPSPPRPRCSETGFPAHKSRPNPSRFRGGQRRSDGIQSKQEAHPSKDRPFASTDSNRKLANPNDRDEIDLENKERLAEMSAEEIEQAQSELMTALSPSLIERLLKKANIDEGRSDEREDFSTAADDKYSISKTSSARKVTFDNKSTIMSRKPSSSSDDTHRFNPDAAPINLPRDLRKPTSDAGYPAPPQFHFPKPPTPPTLDPSDPDFLAELHSTYFPSLPADPNALSWMKPVDDSETEAYSPSLRNISPSALRFDFRGLLLPPRLASQIPITKGLHHHASAPQAAGYTVPELAHLSRSAFPAQRCIAYQTLGRILYRLGTGVFGPEDHELCQGLWKCMDQGRVLDTLLAEAGKDGESGNRSCWATATDAVWLWKKGGGRKWKAT